MSPSRWATGWPGRWRCARSERWWTQNPREGPVELLEDEEPAAVLRVPGLTALWAVEPPLPARARVTGLLRFEHHVLPEGMPPTEGIVRSIQIVTRGLARVADSVTWEPVAGERWLRAVDSCPKRFDDGWRVGADYARSECGVLVGLETRP